MFNLNTVLCGGFSINNHSLGNCIRIENSKYGKDQVVIFDKNGTIHSLVFINDIINPLKNIKGP